MNRTLDTIVLVFQTLSLVAIFGPTCFLFWYLGLWGRTQRPSNGRAHYWHVFYGVAAAVLLLTPTAA